MKDAEAWEHERTFWLGTAEQAEALVDPACLMIAPGTTVMGFEAIRRSLYEDPRWSTVTQTGGVLTRPDPATLNLGYRAVGKRGTRPDYIAYCATTWRQSDGRWRIIHHQQTYAG